MSMSIEESLLEVDRPLDVTGPGRWEAYHRLQSLQIACECSMERPLRVAIATPSDLIQAWSVLRSSHCPRPFLVRWLETCWRSTSEKN
jgi:hypothetical protein